VVICLERDADLHMAQLMPLPLTVSCFSKIQIGFTFLVPAHLGSPEQRAVKWVCVCVTFEKLATISCVCVLQAKQHELHSSIGEALVCAALGSKSPSSRDVWTVTEDEFIVCRLFYTAVLPFSAVLMM